MLLALAVGLQRRCWNRERWSSRSRTLHINNTQSGCWSPYDGVATRHTVPRAAADRTPSGFACYGYRYGSAAMALSAASPSYGWLLACRVALGAGVAVSGPVVASLMGDYFAPGERGRVYGLVLAGEGACTAVGLLVAGQLGAVSWRLGFGWLAVVGLILAVAVATMLREPLRGASSRLDAEAADTASAEDTAAVCQQAQRRSVWREVRYVLSIRTNVVLVVGSSFGYFFTGLSTFGVALLCGRFQIGQAVATLLIYVLGIGALIGVLSTGRIADWLTTRGHISARMVVGGAAFLAAAVFILPTLLTHSLPLALVFAFLAGIALGGVNPPLNAARLDIVHSRLWGTAEAVRTTLVSISTGLAPLVFGIVSTQLGGSTADANAGATAPSAATALNHTFLIMLVSLVIAAALTLCVARRTYPRDVATAMATELLAASAAATERAVPTAGTRLQTLQHQ